EASMTIRQNPAKRWSLRHRQAIPYGPREGADQNRTGVRGFAGLCLATRPRRRAGPWYPRLSLRNPALERRRELQLVGPRARGLPVEVLDRRRHVFHRRGLLGRRVLEQMRGLLAVDDRVDDEQGDMDTLVAQLGRL